MRRNRLRGVSGVRRWFWAQTAPERVPMVEETFKSVQLLSGIPVDTFFEAMGMFASSMGNDCTFCHVEGGARSREVRRGQTPRIAARAADDRDDEGDQQGSTSAARRASPASPAIAAATSPRSDPNLALQYGEPEEDPNARDFPSTDARSPPTGCSTSTCRRSAAPTAGAAHELHGEGHLRRLRHRFAKVPVEIYAKAPNQQTMVVHMAGGDSTRVFDGTNGWMAGPDSPCRS